MTGCEEWRSGYRIYQHPQFGCFQQAAAVAVKILIAFLRADNIETSLDKGTQRKTTENELPSLTQCTA